MNELYSFVYRGILADASLDKIGRQRRRHFGVEDSARLRQDLSFDMLDQDFLFDAQFMAIVYTAIHAFENTIREFVKKAMAEEYDENWWSKVPEKIRKKVASRMGKMLSLNITGHAVGQKLVTVISVTCHQ